jgi:hypothetical protein
VAAFEGLDDGRAGQVEVVAGIAVGAMGEVAQLEEPDEGAVDAFDVEDLEYLADVRGLACLVAGVLPVQPERGLGGLVVPSGSLPELLRTALAPLVPALDAAEERLPRFRHRGGEC